MRRRSGLAAANASTRTRVSRKGARALWDRHRSHAHILTPADRAKNFKPFDSDSGRQAALKSWETRRRRVSQLAYIEALEAKHAQEPIEQDDDDDEA